MAIALGVTLGATGSSLAAAIDFESTPTGVYSSLTYGAATITFTAGTGQFNVDDQTPGPPISGHNIISFFQNPGAGHFKTTIAGGANSFKIGVGDFDADEDHAHLRAFDSSGNLLDSADYINPAATFGGDYLSVASATPIAYVEFWEDGAFAGAVYWDNISYEVSAVPEPETYALMALGLAATGFAARRRRAVK